MGVFSEIHNKIFDRDGQPLAQALRRDAVEGRQVDELLGLVKGVLADGALCEGEVHFLLRWLESNHEIVDSWPASVIYPRIVAALADDHVDPQEEAELMSLLLSLVGGNTAPLHGEHSNSTTLPLCRPLPIIDFSGRRFCFTGAFASGPRVWCEQQTVQRGGESASNITQRLSYLVIGEIGSRDWAHSTFGRKIQKAVEYRDKGLPINIISEQHWYDALQVRA